MFFVNVVFAASLFSAIAALSTQHIDTRIVGGVPAKAGEIPYQAEILEQGHHVCGGSIIHKKWIITAAHCFYNYDKNGKRDKNPLKLDIFTVMVGSNALEKGDKHELDRRFIHENDVFEDIALLRTKSEMDFKNPNIHPIRLSDTPLQLGEVKFSGWGWLKVNSGNTTNTFPFKCFIIFYRLTVVNHQIN